ncbi:MAG: hypothetical protein R3C49_22400 [Planctomycetaceae bacterium]
MSKRKNEGQLSRQSETEVVTTTTDGAPQPPSPSQITLNAQANLHFYPETQLVSVDYLKALDELVPGAAREWVQNTVAESNHRRSLETTELNLHVTEQQEVWKDRANSLQTAKQVVFVLGGCSLVAAVLVAWIGGTYGPIGGGIIGAGGVIGLAREFLKQQKTVGEDRVVDLNKSSSAVDDTTEEDEVGKVPNSRNDPSSSEPTNDS